MKTLKNALIATLVAFTMVSLAYADGIKEKPKFNRVINTNLEKVIQNPDMVKAIYQQVSEADVLSAHQHIYVAQVVYQGNTYRITGTFDQWMRFFRMDGISPINMKYRGIKNY